MCDNVPDLIWAKDLEKKFIFANKAMCNILLNTQDCEEPIGKTEIYFAIRERITHPENTDWHTFGEMSVNSDEIVMNSRRTERFEEYGNVRGEILFLDIYKAPLFNENGTMIGTVGCARDITKEKKLEAENKIAVEALMKSEERYRLILTATPDIMFRINKEGNFIDFHANNLEELVLPPDKIIGTNIKEIFPTKLSERLLSSIIICLDSGLTQVLEYEVSLLDSIHHYEARFIKASDEEVLVILRDITEKKKAEIAFKESDKKYKDLIDHSLLGIYINQNSIFKFCNQRFADIFGYDNPGDIIGLNFKELVSTQDQLNFVDQIKKCELEDSYKLQYQFRGIKKDGTTIDVEVLGGKIFYYGNDAIQGSIIDITERKRAENEIIKAKEKAEEMNRLKNSFLSNMSHELRTPLIGVMGFAELLSTDLTDPEFRSRANMIYESGSRLLETLNQILDLSAIEANSWVMDFKTIDICESAKFALEKFGEFAKRKNLYIKLICKDEELYSSLDPKVFHQVLSNLINNAIKYTSSGGVKIGVSKEFVDDQEWNIVKVVDSGIGIPSESIKIIFDPFRQASEGYHRRYEGTGLGLTITKKLVEAMNGIIEVESKEGEGSAFKVRFPVVYINAEAYSKSLRAKEQNSLLSGSNKTAFPLVLFVEDDEINRSVVKQFLKDSCMLDLTSTGETSIEMAKKKKYSAILMDLKLAGKMSGLDAAKEIRKIQGYHNVPIVAVTAYSLSGGKEGILKEGCTHYLPKPFSREKLLKLVEEILDN
jgi:PAS domain S-box-containing protein